MKTILCYGDSNTWGYTPGTGAKIPFERKWPGVMQALLGPRARVIDEGLNGRTTVFDDPFWEGRNGKEFLFVLLQSHAPIDVVVIFLGVNDLKHIFHASAADIAKGLATLIQIIKGSYCGPNGKTPHIVVMCPPPLTKLTDYFELEFMDGKEKSFELPRHMEKTARDWGCHYFDTPSIAAASNDDGVHLDEENHRKIGGKMAALVGGLLDDQPAA